MNFQTAPIGALFDVKNGATPKSDNPDFWGGDIPWLTPADLGKLKGTATAPGEKSITDAGLNSCGTQIVPIGALVISIRAPIGHLAIASSELCFNQGCRGLVPRDGLDGKFAYWAISAAKPELQNAGQGTTFMELSRGKLRSIHISYPDLPTQKRIAAFLDRETARIDELIAKKERLLHNFGPRLEALVATALTDKSLPRIRFEHVSEPISRPCALSDHDELVRLGLYNRGRGIFKKPAADEEGMGDSSFYFVEDGDLILSGQFAWEGAVAMAGQSECGCVVSHRYPVYRGKNLKTSYLLAFFRSSYGDFVLNDASRGSAGRNRPLNTRRLGKEKIPVPSEHLQEQIEHTINAESRLRAVHFASIERLREYRAALITAAVTGQIDVETYGKAGTTSETLDQIEEEIQG